MILTVLQELLAKAYTGTKIVLINYFRKGEENVKNTINVQFSGKQQCLEIILI